MRWEEMKRYHWVVLNPKRGYVHEINQNMLSGTCYAVYRKTVGYAYKFKGLDVAKQAVKKLNVYDKYDWEYEPVYTEEK